MSNRNKLIWVYDEIEENIKCPICSKSWNVVDNCTETFKYCPNCGQALEEPIKFKISNDEWAKAYDNAIYHLGWYSSVPNGIFGSIIIKNLIKRFDNGERTKELYDEMMKCG